MPPVSNNKIIVLTYAVPFKQNKKNKDALHNKQTADNLAAKSLGKQVSLQADLKESSVDAWLIIRGREFQRVEAATGKVTFDYRALYFSTN